MSSASCCLLKVLHRICMQRPAHTAGRSHKTALSPDGLAKEGAAWWLLLQQGMHVAEARLRLCFLGLHTCADHAETGSCCCTYLATTALNRCLCCTIGWQPQQAQAHNPLLWCFCSHITPCTLF